MAGAASCRIRGLLNGDQDYLVLLSSLLIVTSNIQDEGNMPYEPWIPRWDKAHDRPTPVKCGEIALLDCWTVHPRLASAMCSLELVKALDES